MLNAVECLRSLLIHLLREAEVGYTDDIVAANLRCVRLQLLVCEVHLTQGLEDAVEINLAFTHSGVLMDGVVSRNFSMAAEHARVLLETCLGIAFGFIIVDVISRSIMRAQGKEYHMGKKSTVIKKNEKYRKKTASRTGEKHRERAFSLGVTNYMGKPFQEAELLENIEDLLTDKREVY